MSRSLRTPASSIAAILVAAAASHAQTQCGSEDAKVSPTTGLDGDNFGSSFDAAAAGFGIVGAPDAGDEAGGGAGRAYLYTLNTAVPQLLFELLPDDAIANQQFGSEVAADNALALVGAPFDGELGPAAGAAYLFLRSTGTQLDKLTASDGRGLDLFGNALDVDFDRAVVAAPDKSSATGAVYVFEVVGTDAVERFKLTASDAAAVDRFGSSVAIDGGGVTAGEVAYALIGAPLNDDVGSSSGSAYLFNIETGEEIAKILPDDGAMGDNFGAAVDLLIEGDVALAAIAATGANPDGSDGSVYLFDVSNRSAPVQLARVTATDTFTPGDFGVSVSLTAEVLLAGALSGETSLAGTAYTFDITDPAAPIQTAIIRPTDPVPFARFGSSASLYEGPTGLRLFVGAPADDAGTPIAGDPGVGALHAFTLDFCRPDIDGDCLLTLFDFLGFQNLFDAGDLAADFDGDGSLTLFDFLAFQNAFDAGC